jgi:hypothetical protein
VFVLKGGRKKNSGEVAQLEHGEQRNRCLS